MHTEAPLGFIVAVAHDRAIWQNRALVGASKGDNLFRPRYFPIFGLFPLLCFSQSLSDKPALKHATFRALTSITRGR